MVVGGLTIQLFGRQIASPSWQLFHNSEACLLSSSPSAMPIVD